MSVLRSCFDKLSTTTMQAFRRLSKSKDDDPHSEKTASEMLSMTREHDGVASKTQHERDASLRRPE
jgi:hypothetical protein